MTVKQRLKTIEKEVKPVKKFDWGKVWSIFGDSESIEKQVEEIETGKVKHPETGEQYEPKDTFVLIHIVDTKKQNQDAINALEEEKERLLREVEAMEKAK